MSTNSFEEVNGANESASDADSFYIATLHYFLELVYF